MPRPELALRQAHRVLRTGGRIAFTIWAVPAENIAWKLVLDAVRCCGNQSLSRAPVSGGSFSRPADWVFALAAAAFVEAGTAKLSRI